MKRSIVDFVRAIGYLLSSRIANKIINVIKQLWYYFVSGWTRRLFRKCGRNFYLQPPFNIIGQKYIEIGDNFHSYAGLRLEAYDEHLGHKFSPNIEIGNNVSFNYNCHIGCINHVKIGNGVLIASRVFITDHYHGETNEVALAIPPAERKLHSKGSVIIDDNVWIGEGVSILPNVRIGRNSIIGANAVVTRSFPDNSIIGGIPARLIKESK